MKKFPPAFISTWFNKFFECFVTFIFLRDLAHEYLPLDQSIYNTQTIYFESLFTGWNSLIVIFMVIFSLWWNREEKKEKFNSPALHDWLRSIMCYFAAYLLFQYGFAKVYNDQFHHTYYRDDSLAGKLSGFAVAWNFFNYSYYFTLLIGLLQIGGGILLLFFKTRVAGALMLLPIMVNILLINLFYGVSPAAFINAILITIAICYIAWLQRRQLLALFFREHSDVLSKKMHYVKAALRIIVIVFAFTAGYPYRQPGDGTFYTGKWNIVQLIRNGKTVDRQQWQNDPMAWNNVYIEANGNLAFSANPSYYDYSKKRTTSYRYKIAKDRLLLRRYPNNIPADTATVNIQRYNQNKMQWNTILHGDTLQMELSRQADTIKNIVTDGDLR